MCRVAEESLVKEGQKCIGEDASRQQVDDAYMLVFTLGDMSPHACARHLFREHRPRAHIGEFSHS